MFRSIFLLLLWSFSNFILADIDKVAFRTQAVSLQQWQVIDIVLKAKNNVKQAFTQEVYAIVKDDDTRKIPLFYNGNNEWVLRFSSAKTGSILYTIDGEIAEFRGLKGHFKVSKNSKKNRHGGIVLKKSNPQHFFYEDGSDYFSLAFEADWLFALDYNKKNLSKATDLLDVVRDNGFNQIVTTLYSYDVKWQKDSKLKHNPEYEYGGREDIFPFLGSNSKPDFSQLNVEFFQHYDKIMSACTSGK